MTKRPPLGSRVGAEVWTSNTTLTDVTVYKEFALGTSLQTPCRTAHGRRTVCNSLVGGVFILLMYS